MTDTFARMRQLNGTTAEWAANDLVIGLGEFAIEKIAGGAMRLKLGDGIAKFSQLAYFDPGIFSYVLRGGDTMTGPLIVPAVTINAGGLTVSAGASTFSAPVNLGPGATVGEPPTAGDNDSTVPTTHWCQQLVGGIITGLEIKGAWDAATNTPALASGGLGVPTPQRGDFYIVSVTGSTMLDGNDVWNAGDSVVFNGFAWQRVPQTLAFEQIVAGLGYTPVNKAGDIMTGTLTAPAIISGPVSVGEPGNAANLKNWRELVTPTAGDLEFRPQTDAHVDVGGPAVTFKRDGSLVAPGIVRLYGDVLLAANAAEMRVNVPGGAKKIELEYLALNVAAASDTLAVRVLNGATPNTTGAYHTQHLFASTNVPSATQILNATYWQLGAGIVSAKGVLHPAITSGQSYVNGTSWASTAAQMYTFNSAFHGAASAGATGFQVFNVAGALFQPGSFLRCYVST